VRSPLLSVNPLKTEREEEVENRGVGESEKVLGEVRATLLWGGERASFCKVPRLRPLVLLIRVE
jgi:hypothetical protein